MFPRVNHGCKFLETFSSLTISDLLFRCQVEHGPLCGLWHPRKVPGHPKKPDQIPSSLGFLNTLGVYICHSHHTPEF